MCGHRFTRLQNLRNHPDISVWALRDLSFMMGDHKGMDRLVVPEEHMMVESQHRLNSPVSVGLEQQRHFLSKLWGLKGKGLSVVGAEVLDHQRQFLSKLGGLEVPKLGVGAGVLLLTSVTSEAPLYIIYHICQQMRVFLRKGGKLKISR